jgi:hypothetical protein
LFKLIKQVVHSSKEFSCEKWISFATALLISHLSFTVSVCLTTNKIDKVVRKLTIYRICFYYRLNERQSLSKKTKCRKLRNAFVFIELIVYTGIIDSIFRYMILKSKLAVKRFHRVSLPTTWWNQQWCVFVSTTELGHHVHPCNFNLTRLNTIGW